MSDWGSGSVWNQSPSLHFNSFPPAFIQCLPRGQLRITGHEEENAAPCSFQGAGNAAGVTGPHRLMLKEQEEICPRTKGRNAHSRWQYVQEAGAMRWETRAEGLGGFAFMKTSGGGEAFL